MSNVKWVVLSDTALPTEDIYFLNSVAPWLAEQGYEVKKINTRRWTVPPMSKKRFAKLVDGAYILVSRSLSLRWIELLETQRTWSAVYYLIDDDFEAAVQDERLPQIYRHRLAGILSDHQPRLLSLATEVVVPSLHLQAILKKAHRNVQMMTPPWLSQPGSLEHFGYPNWTLAFHGTRAHLPDLEHIAPAIQIAHDRRSTINFEIMLGKHTPEKLKLLSRVATPRPLSWSAFRHYQRFKRIHVGLVPLWDTPFNNAKSFIKYLDVAAMGGVGIFSNREPYRSIVHHGVDGLLVEDDPEAWADAMLQLTDDRDRTRWMADKAREKASAIGDSRLAQRFWWSRMQAKRFPADRSAWLDSRTPELLDARQ
ncbi:glycosyltransferase [Salinicola sp. NYA28a]